MIDRNPCVIILVGGENSRFLPLQHKSFFAFNGKTLFEMQLEQLIKLGMSDIVVVANATNTQMVEEGLRKFPNVLPRVAVQGKPKGMGDALLSAAEAYGEIFKKRALYVVQPHDIVDPRLHEGILARWRQYPSTGVLASKKVDADFPGGYLRLDNGVVKGVVEKPERRDLVAGWPVTIVAHLHPDATALLEAVSAAYGEVSLGDDHYERAITNVAAEHTYVAFDYQGVWIPIKYPWDVLDAMDHFLNTIDGQHISPSARVSPNALIRGPVVISDEAQVFPGAHILGPVFVGPHAIIGDNTLVRRSSIGSRAVVGFATEVVRSWVGEDVWFHTNYVGDSVIDHNVSLGSGTVLANLRFDEMPVRSLVAGQLVNTGRQKFGSVIGVDARLGVNVSTWPGVKIGRNSWICPGVVLKRDVENDIVVDIETKLTSRQRSAQKAEDRSRFRELLQ